MERSFRYGWTGDVDRQRATNATGIVKRLKTRAGRAARVIGDAGTRAYEKPDTNTVPPQDLVSDAQGTDWEANRRRSQGRRHGRRHGLRRTKHVDPMKSDVTRTVR